MRFHTCEDGFHIEQMLHPIVRLIFQIIIGAIGSNAIPNDHANGDKYAEEKNSKQR